ncbi:MAG: hypothetical protein LC101_04895 [Flavobacteriales bacterium]|nr:hypothetical protein [Flavobacteriales bacterium]
MKRNLIISVFMLCMVMLSMPMVQGQSYQSPRLAEAKFSHKTMAILPVYVTEKDNSSTAKKEGRQGITQEDETEGYNLQRSFYNYFITRKPKKVNWTLKIQTYEETNQKLKDAGIDYTNIIQTPKDKLGQILGVDAIFICEINKLRTISDAGAVAVDFLVGYGGYTGNIDIATSIFESSSAELMWKFNHKIPTSYWGRSDYLVDNIMKATINKFPYKEKTK